MKQILVATGFSQYEKRAFDRAVLLATEHQAALEVLHVITPASVDALCKFLPDPRRIVEEKLTNSIYAQLYYLVDRVESDRPIAILPRVKIAEVEDGIIKSAESCDSDLIVLGSHGEYFAHELFVGTTAENILAREKRPALIAKRKVVAPYSKIGVPVDFSEQSATVVSKVCEMFPNAMICLLHAFQIPNHEHLSSLGMTKEQIKRDRSEFYDQATREIAKLAAEKKDDRISRVVEMGYPPAMIQHWTENLHFDLIVMGKRGDHLGSVVRHVLHNSACDVMVVG